MKYTTKYSYFQTAHVHKQGLAVHTTTLTNTATTKHTIYKLGKPISSTMTLVKVNCKTLNNLQCQNVCS